MYLGSNISFIEVSMKKTNKVLHLNCFLLDMECIPVNDLLSEDSVYKFSKKYEDLRGFGKSRSYYQGWF